MTNAEYIRVKTQVAVLKELLPVYGGRTLENIIQGLESRIAECEIQAMKRAVASVKSDNTNYVDLGLPSGTLWADRNVGADNPEDFGDYLKFDDAQKYECPMLEQIKELLDNCSSEWINVNGIKGRKFIGKNGKSIFFPAAGDRWNDNTRNVGSYGFYWSSTQSPYRSDNAYYLSFGSGSTYWLSYSRSYGRSVRPVKK